MKNKKTFFILTLLLVCKIIFSNNQIDQNFFYKKIENGLDCFIMQNNNAPLVYIEIALKAGSIKQNFNNAGLFHLYEHIMFKGNSKYKNAEEVQRAINNLGVSSWNGSTADEYVNYYFTIPSNLLEEGLQFWASAIQNPLIDEKELEKEKKVVISEIEGDLNTPQKIFYNGMIKNLFCDYPWQLDPAGFSQNIQNCTVEKLKHIKELYYVPNNAAIFIGGDVNFDYTMELINKYFGAWQPSAFVPKHKKQNKNPFNEPKLMFIKDESLTPLMAQVFMYYRGPDSLDDQEATFAADVFGNLIIDPKSKFTENICKNPIFKIPNSNYFASWYTTKLASGIINFVAMFSEPENNLPQRVKTFYDTIQNIEIPKIVNDKKYFSKKEFKVIKQKLLDNKLLSQETPEEFLNSLRYYWASTNVDYFYNYEENLLKVDHNKIANYLTNYIINNNPLIIVKIHPDIYESQKKDFNDLGFEEITNQNAFYWQDEFYINNANQTQEKNSSLPKQKNNSFIKSETNIQIHKLKNNIPVYIYNNSSNSVQNIRIVVKGGATELSQENAGLEDALFNMMCNGSKKYSKEKIDKILYDKSANIEGYGKKEYSQISLSSLDYYFYDVLPLLIDGFLNPSYDEDELKNLITNYDNSIQNNDEDPQSLLMKITTDNIYDQHKYKISATPTKNSLQNINIENLKLQHKKVLNASRIYVIASGNFNTQKLIKTLDKTLGKIKSLEYSPQKVQDVKVPNIDIEDNCKASNGTAYRIIAYNYPTRKDKAFFSAQLAGMIYDEILYNIVREKKGSCYSVGTSVYGSTYNFGFIYGININNLDTFNEGISEAEKYFLSLNEEQISKRLEGVKNSYIASIFSADKTNEGITAQILISNLIYNDPEEYKNNFNIINNVTAKDIINSFKKYYLNSNKAQFTVKGTE